MSFAAILSGAGEGWTRFPEERAPMKEALRVDYERLYAEDIAPTLTEVDLTELPRERIEAATRELPRAPALQHPPPARDTVVDGGDLPAS